MYYIRKFEDNLWHQYNYSKTGKISGAALTVSLNAKNNALSLWRVTDLSNIEKEGLLALIASMDSIDKIDVIIFTQDELARIGLNLKDTKGLTPISTLEDLHTDIVELDLDSLNSFAHLFARKISEKESKEQVIKEKINQAKQKREDTSIYEKEIKDLCVRRYTRNSIIRIFEDAIANKLCKLDELKASAKNNIEKKGK